MENANIKPNVVRHAQFDYTLSAIVSGKEFRSRYLGKSLGDAKKIFQQELKMKMMETNVQDENGKKMKAVLRKLVESFPEFETDEQIDGSDAVATLCGMWEEIKEAAK